MSLKISANSFATQRYLVVKAGGVTFCETSFMGGQRRFRFEEIDAVLMSTDNVLAFQVGQEVFSLPVKPSKPKHQQTIDALVEGVIRSQQGGD